jgi:hypothetical protein
MGTGWRSLVMPCRRRHIDVARGTLKCGPLLGLAPRTGVIVLCLDRPCSAPPPPSVWHACWPNITPRPTASCIAPHSATTLSTTSAAFVDCSPVWLRFCSGQPIVSASYLGTRAHACSLDSGLPRYDSLTVSDSPPSSVLCSLLRRSSNLRTPHQSQEPQ